MEFQFIKNLQLQIFIIKIRKYRLNLFLFQITEINSFFKEKNSSTISISKFCR